MLKGGINSFTQALRERLDGKRCPPPVRGMQGKDRPGEQVSISWVLLLWGPGLYGVHVCPVVDLTSSFDYQRLTTLKSLYYFDCYTVV